MLNNPLREMLAKRTKGIHCGIPSYCTANKLVIEALLEQAQRFDDNILIEATANQVNQFGGYTGMQPADFRDFVFQIADNCGFPREKLFLGGDHLGPLTWASLPEEEAMENAVTLVKLFVKAGYKKIHLDTSMKLGDDPVNERLSDEVIAGRGARLYKACEETFQEMRKDNPDEMHPVFIIGSEVPIPGGAQEEEDCISVTKTSDFENTLNTYHKKFAELGLENAWEHIIGVVVQPGVEFGDASVFPYNREAAADLCASLKNHPGIVFEGHSTDYQTAQNLRAMVEDGIAILKVGPALTYALREGLFGLSMIEKELITDENKRADFMETLEAVMLENPGNWQKHYHGNEHQLALSRRYSFSDRSRYYMTDAKVEAAIDRLFENLRSVELPLNIIRQYLPLQYVKVRDGKLSADPAALCKDCVVNVAEDYNYAVKHNYVISGIFYA